MRRGRLLVGLLALFLVAVLAGSVMTIVQLLGTGGPRGGGGQVLVVPISGPLPEQPFPDEPIAALGRNVTSIFEIDLALRHAASDDAIEHLLILPGSLPVGYAKIQELRDSIQRFKSDSGKPVTCWMEAVSNKEYYLATACDQIYMAPEGFFLVNGLHLSVTFFKGTLDKLGIEAEFARAGKYKSAIEPMISTEMSPAFREMMEALATSLYDDFVEAISQSRGLSDAEVRALIDDPPLTASGAARAGLIDGLLYEDQLEKHLAGGVVRPRSSARYDNSWMHDGPAVHIGTRHEEVHIEADDVQAVAIPSEDEGEAKAVAVDATDLGEAEDIPSGDGDLLLLDEVKLSDYLADHPSRAGSKPRIAIIFCEGTIVSGKSESGGGMGGTRMGSDTIAAAIAEVREDERVLAVVLRVNSPGGSGLASDIIWRELELTRAVKPVIVSMSDYAASGGYYISMNADAIVAQPGTLTGSIGVYAGKYNIAGLYEKLGLRSESIDRGEFSDLFALNQPLGEDGRAKLSEFIDEFYGGFITKAAAGRGVTPGAIHAVAQGRVWTGRQAYELGLVDELGSLRTAIAIAKEKASIEGDVSLLLRPRRPTFLQELLGTGPGVSALALLLDSPSSASNLQLKQAAQHILSGVELFAAGTPVLLAPFHVQSN
jgi:protease-4